jgi:hypothetical protein
VTGFCDLSVLLLFILENLPMFLKKLLPLVIVPAMLMIGTSAVHAAGQDQANRVAANRAAAQQAQQAKQAAQQQQRALARFQATMQNSKSASRRAP